jgi:NAD(P)-dependent dehydrogenase (short-subunit alcohol dehydrogenase family)
MSNTTLKGRNALITGASKGLGRAMAIALAQHGAHLVLVARSKDKLESVAKEAEEAGGTASVFAADITDETQVLQLEKDIAAQVGKVQILVNNAGMNLRKNITDYTLDEWRSVQDTNLTSVFLMCRSFVPHMKGSGYGRIINMTSIMAHVSLPQRTAYSSTKFALLGLTKALALELATEGITVVGISPGPFATEMNTPILAVRFEDSGGALGQGGRDRRAGGVSVFGWRGVHYGDRYSDRRGLVCDVSLRGLYRLRWVCFAGAVIASMFGVSR